MGNGVVGWGGPAVGWRGWFGRIWFLGFWGFFLRVFGEGWEVSDESEGC